MTAAGAADHATTTPPPTGKPRLHRAMGFRDLVLFYRVAIFVAALGFTTTTLSIGLATLPPEGEANQVLAVVKIVGLSLLLVAMGVVVYALGRAGAARRRALDAAVDSPAS